MYQELKAWQIRNTPTSVGKTSVENTKPIGKGKHPHERGEDWVKPSVAVG